MLWLQAHFKVRGIGAACPSPRPCCAAGAASRHLQLLAALRAFLAGFSGAKMASHSLAALGGLPSSCKQMGLAFLR